MEVRGALVSFIGTGLAPLQVMGSGTSEVLKHLLLRWCPVSIHNKEFEFKARVVCSDKAGYNMKAERSLVSERPEWVGIHRQCDIHCISTTYTRTLEQLVGGDISGMIHASLALQAGEALNVFRQCLRAVLREKLVILRGFLSEEARAHKEKLLNVFFTGHTPLSMTQRAVITLVANGDWRKATVIEHLVNPDTPNAPNAEEIVKLMESSFVFVFAARRPDTFPRHRWTGGDQAIDFLGRMESVHQLLSATFEKFVQHYGSTTSGATTSATTQTPEAHAHSVGATAGLSSSSGGHAHGGDSQAMPGSHAHCPDQHPSHVPESITAAQHSHDRRIGLGWVRGKPYSQLIMLRLVVEPLRILLSKNFHVSSEEFEIQQRALVARQVAQGDPESHKRDFMVTLAAENRFELEYFQDLSTSLNDSQRWSLVDIKDHAVAFRSMCFKLVSRQGALVWQLVGHTHTHYLPNAHVSVVRVSCAGQRLCPYTRMRPRQLVQEGACHTPHIDRSKSPTSIVHPCLRSVYEHLSGGSPTWNFKEVPAEPNPDMVNESTHSFSGVDMFVIAQEVALPVAKDAVPCYSKG